MAQAIFMTNAQVEELITIVRQTHELWQKLRDRELEGEKRYASAQAQGKWPDDNDVILDPPLRPSFDELLIEFLTQQYGADYHRFERLSLTIGLRRELCIELNLPLYLLTSV